MTIKKTVSLKRPGSKGSAKAPAADGSAAPSGGGAAIADRLKLDVPDKAASAKTTSTGTKIAVIAALVALVVAGILAFTLYDHWEFLKGA